MWKSNEIVQGDSGLVVSNKLDAEFQRIQTEEARVDALFQTLDYADQTDMLDKAEEKKIVSPKGMWFVLDPLVNRFNTVEEVTSHLSQETFNGVSWIKTDVLIEYTGSYVPLSRLSDGNFITKSHIMSLEAGILGEALLKDGSTPLPVGYVPPLPESVVNKGYVDAHVLTLTKKSKMEYIEFPGASNGDTVFAADLDGKVFVVYLNGVLQRRVKYSALADKIRFNDPLEANDEVTIHITGEIL